MSRTRIAHVFKSNKQVSNHFIRPLQPESIFFNLPKDLLGPVLSPYLCNQSLLSLSNSCVGFHNLYSPILKKRPLPTLLRGVIDDDINLVNKILNVKPELILEHPLGLEIESNYTYQKFYSKKAFYMAIERNQIQMARIIFSHYESLFGKHEFLSQHVSEDLRYIKKMQRTEQDCMDLRVGYSTLLQPLVDAIIADKNCVKDFSGKLGPVTEEVLTKFRREVLPNSTIELKEYYDINQLLLAAYEVFVANYHKLKTWQQRCIYCIRVIGFIQSLVTPEIGKILCESLYLVVGYKYAISERAEKLLLDANKIPFYRASRDSLAGLGGQYFVDVMRCTTYFYFDYSYDNKMSIRTAEENIFYLKKLLAEKREDFLKLIDELQTFNSLIVNSPLEKSSQRCSIS